jgi:hypothetical protein
LPLNEKRAGALFLVNLYNAGIRNAITPEDIEEIADVLTQDKTLNYPLLAPIFD